MHLDGAGPGLFGSASHVAGRFLLGRGSGTNLERDRNGNGPHHGGHDPTDRRRIGQQCPPFTSVQEPANRAFKVQIDQIKALLLDHAGRSRENFRLSAADLAGSGRLLRGAVEQSQGPPVAPGHVDPVDALAAHQSRSELLHE